MLKMHIKSKATKKKKGQSTVEYLILIGCVMAALVVFLRPNGIFHQRVNSALNIVTSDMENMATRMLGSHPAT